MVISKWSSLVSCLYPNPNPNPNPNPKPKPNPNPNPNLTLTLTLTPCASYEHCLTTQESNAFLPPT